MKRDPRLVRLSREHTQALMLGQRLSRELPGASPEQLAQLQSDVVRFWAAGLLVHFRAEGECLLARLVRHLPMDHTAVRKLQTDHLGIEALVATMRDAAGDEAIQREALRAFGETLKVHVRWEEEELFPLAERELTSTELDRLGEDLSDRLPEHPLPAPTGPHGASPG